MNIDDKDINYKSSNNYYCNNYEELNTEMDIYRYSDVLIDYCGYKSLFQSNPAIDINLHDNYNNLNIDSTN